MQGNAYLFTAPNSNSKLKRVLYKGEKLAVNRIVHKDFDDNEDKLYAEVVWHDFLTGYVSMQSQHLTIFDPDPDSVFAQHQEMSKKAAKAVSGHYEF